MELKEALRSVMEDMAQQEEAVQADLEHKAAVILAQQRQIALLDAAVQVTCSLSAYPSFTEPCFFLTGALIALKDASGHL